LLHLFAAAAQVAEKELDRFGVELDYRYPDLRGLRWISRRCKLSLFHKYLDEIPKGKEYYWISFDELNKLTRVNKVCGDNVDFFTI